MRKIILRLRLSTTRCRFLWGVASWVIGCALLARVLTGWVTDPPPLNLSSASQQRRAATLLNLGLGRMLSRYDVIQRGFGGEAIAAYPGGVAEVHARFDEPRSGMTVVAGWHPCNPGLANGKAIDLMGGGEGCLDVSTSGGGMWVKSVHEDSLPPVQISWVLVGTSGGACTVDMEAMLAQEGAMLKKVQQLRDELAAVAALNESYVGVDACTKPLPEERIAFVDRQGHELATASVGDACWVRRVKGAFRESYLQPNRQGQARVTFLILDYILRSQRFQDEVAMVLGGD